MSIRICFRWISDASLCTSSLRAMDISSIIQGTTSTGVKRTPAFSMLTQSYILFQTENIVITKKANYCLRVYRAGFHLRRGTGPPFINSCPHLNFKMPQKQSDRESKILKWNVIFTVPENAPKVKDI